MLSLDPRCHTFEFLAQFMSISDALFDLHILAHEPVGVGLLVLVSDSAYAC